MVCMHTYILLVRKCNIFKNLQSFFSNSTADESQFLNSDQVKKLQNELEALMKKPGYFGLTDNIEWVLKVARDSSNTFEDCDNFISYVVCDNLFTEKYHHLA